MGFIVEKGVLTYKSQVEAVTSKNGNIWQKQTIVVSRENVNAPYDKVALSVFGDKVNDSERCRVGDKVEITYSISAKEYNGRWYNDVSLYKIVSQDAAFARPAQGAAPAADSFPQDNEPLPDLPF